MSDALRLDDQQAHVALAAVGARLVVIAGPGAGKTEVVGARCRHLVDSEQAYPEEILLISFSNAAVDVVRRRTVDVVDQGQGVDVCTIDSLAQRIRGELDPDDGFTGYDAAIRNATALLLTADGPVFPDVRHVVVDEVQDVVGDRARLVLQLLRTGVAPGTGFTLLGDPMQALYDFQLSDDDPMTSTTLLERVRAEFHAEDVFLTGQYRAQTDDARRASDVRADLSGVRGPLQLTRIRGVESALSPLGPLDDNAAQIVEKWAGTTALLCDTNARAVLAADRLAAYGVPTDLVPRATDDAVDPWVGRCLADVPAGRIARDDFLGRLTAAGVPHAEEWWLRCLLFTGDPSDLNLRRLAMALARPNRDFRRAAEHHVRISTVHRAKGLEFDNVVLVDPLKWRDDAGSTLSRQLFVALSRARRRVTTMDGVDTASWRKDPSMRMWANRGWKGRRGGLYGVVIEPHHLVTEPLTAEQFADVAAQPVVWSDPEEVLTVDRAIIPRWTALVGGVTIGATTDDFGTAVAAARYKSAWPLLRGGRVEGCETVARPEDNRYGPHGIALGARVVGHVATDWS